MTIIRFWGEVLVSVEYGEFWRRMEARVRRRGHRLALLSPAPPPRRARPAGHRRRGRGDALRPPRRLPRAPARRRGRRAALRGDRGARARAAPRLLRPVLIARARRGTSLTGHDRHVAEARRARRPRRAGGWRVRGGLRRGRGDDRHGRRRARSTCSSSTPRAGSATAGSTACGLRSTAPGARCGRSRRSRWLGGARGDGAGGKLVFVAPRADAGEHAAAAAAALENLARTLAVEWARFGVRATAIAPGPRTPTTRSRRSSPFLASAAGEYFSGCRFDLR